MSDLPTGLLVEATLSKLSARGVFYYITQKGNHGSGIILLKLLDRQGGCKLLTQQRDLDGNLGWTGALEQDLIEESAADEYIARAKTRDPDLWVIEIEDPNMQNPFEE